MLVGSSAWNTAARRKSVPSIILSSLSYSCKDANSRVIPRSLRGEQEVATRTASLFGMLLILAALAGSPVKAAPAPVAQVLQLYSYELRDKVQFEQGYQRHLAWHATHDDKLVWFGWMVDSGRRKGLFVDGTAGASYAALDTRPDLTGDAADAVRNFLPFAQARNVETWELWPGPSTATPLEDHKPRALVDVYVMHATPGSALHFERLLSKLAEKRRSRSASLTWYKAARGGALPAYMPVLSRSDWADVEHAGGTLSALLARVYGVGPAEVGRLLEALTDVEVECWSYQPRLSLIPGTLLEP